MTEPLVTVLLPTHNRPELLGRALESAVFQTYANLEILVVDDASSGSTRNVLSGIRDPRVRVLRNEKNLGFVRSLNKGLGSARGEYIARLDDDDSWCDEKKLEKQVEFLESRPEYVLVGGGIIRVDGKGREISRQLFCETDEEIRGAMLLSDPFVHPSVVFRAEAARKAGGYDEGLDYAQDWDLFMNLGRFGRYYNFPEYFVRYLQSSQNRSNKRFRHHLRLCLEVRRRHRREFPNFLKGYLFGLVSYALAFVPVRRRVHPRLLRLREWVVR